MNWKRVILCLLGLVVFRAVGYSQQSGDEIRNSKQDFKVRRIYVPESDLQKLIRGRYLPLKIETFEEFVEKLRSVNQDNSIERFDLQLEWEPELGFRGTCRIELAEESDGRSVGFESNLQFSKLSCVDSPFSMEVLGQDVGGKYQIVSLAGKVFECEVTIPHSPESRSQMIRMPVAKDYQISVTLPEDVLWVTDSEFQLVELAPLASKTGRNHFISTSGNSAFSFAVLNRKDSSSFVSTSDEITFLSDLVRWKSQVSLSTSDLAKSDFLIWFDKGWDCRAVFQDDRDLDFSIVESTGNRTCLRIAQDDIVGNDLFLRLVFETSAGSKTKFEFSPLSIGKTGKTRSELIVTSSPEWLLSELELNGYQISRVDPRNGVNLFQNGAEAVVRIHRKRRVQVPKTEKLDFDVQNTQLTVRQRIDNLPSQSTILLNDGWEIESVIDIEQDELPVNFTTRFSTKGQILTIENESAEVWIIGNKLLDTVDAYTASDFVPVKVSLDKAQVQFRPGFLNRFQDGLESTTGIPNPLNSFGTESFAFEELSGLRFRLVADEQQFKTEFQTFVHFDHSDSAESIRYEIDWEKQKSNRIVIELGASKLENLAFSNGVSGFVRSLSVNEKQILGLPLTRQFWIFEVPADSSPESKVSFSLPKTPDPSNRYPVLLPRGVGDSVNRGLLKVSSEKRITLIAQGSPLLELPESSQTNERIFEFGTQGLVTISEAKGTGERDQSGTVHLLRNRLDLVDSQNYVQHLEIACRSDADLQSNRQWQEIRIESPNTKITNVRFKNQNQLFVAQQGETENEKDSWILELSDRDSGFQLLQVEITGSRFQELSWNPLVLPAIRLNGQLLQDPAEVSVANDWYVFDAGSFLSSSIDVSLRNIYWLPSIAIDTPTANQFANQGETKQLIVTSEKIDQWYLASRKFVTVLAFAIVGLFVLLTLLLPRNRHAIYLLLFLLASATLLGGIYGLAVSMAFWGAAIGIVVRELRRLTRFEIVDSSKQKTKRSVAKLLVFILTLLSTHSVYAQEELQTSKQLKDRGNRLHKEVPVLLPVDKESRPTGLAYIPAEFYQQLSSRDRVKSLLICEDAKLVIESESNSSVFVGTLELKLYTDASKTVRIPFDVPGAIFDSESVRVDSSTVQFRPVGRSSKELELALPRAGKQTVAISFQVPDSSQNSTRLNFPFVSNCRIDNYASEEFFVSGLAVADRSTKPAEFIRPNGSLRRAVTGGIRIGTADALDDSVMMVEFLRFSRDQVSRSIQLYTKNGFRRELRISKGEGLVAEDKGNDVVQRGEEIVANSVGKTDLGIKFVATEFPTQGQLIEPTAEVLNMPVREHLLIVQTEDQLQIDCSHSVMENADLRRTKNLLDRMIKTSESGQFDATYDIRRTPFVRFWVKPIRDQLNCVVNHNYFVQKETVELVSEFDISVESPTPVIEFEIPQELRNVEFRLGNRILPTIQTGVDRVTVDVDLQQPGRYLLEIRTSFPITDGTSLFVNPKIPDVAASTMSFYWSGRERAILSPFIAVDDLSSPRKGFRLAGSMTGSGHSLITGPYESVRKTVVTETVEFKSSQTTHKISVRLPQKPKEGQWLGFDLPPSCEILEESRNELEKKYSADFVYSDSLQTHQFWVPASEVAKDGLVFSFQQNPISNRIRCLGLVGQAEPSHQIRLPKTYNSKRIDWQADEAVKIREEGGFSFWQTNRSGVTATYQVQSEEKKPLSILSIESRFDPVNRKLRTRLFVSPGDNRKVTLSLPVEQMIESVQVCGKDRKYLRTQDGGLVIELLSQRFLQIIDLTTLLGTYEPSRESIVQIPTVADLASPKSIFQVVPGWRPAGKAELVDISYVTSTRIEYAEQALLNYELNGDESRNWFAILRNCVDSVIPIDQLETSTQESLENGLPITSRRLKQGLRPATSFVTPGAAIYLLEGTTAILEPIPKEVVGNRQWRVLGSIGLALAGVFLVGRLPSWICSTLYSLVLICGIWVLGVVWVFVTPHSMFAWCWMLLAGLFVLLFGINITQRTRFQIAQRKLEAAGELDGSFPSTKIKADREKI